MSVAQQDWLDRIWPLMLQAFPPNERRQKAAQRAVLKRPEVRLRALTEGGRVTGFAIWWELPSCRFIEHLAVADGLRGGGRGARLLDLACEGAEKPVVLEIELPESSGQAGRRLHFYRRHGFLCNEFDYLQMPLNAGDGPTPMRILSYRKGLTARAFEPMKAEIYRAVYGIGEQ